MELPGSRHWKCHRGPHYDRGIRPAGRPPPPPTSSSPSPRPSPTPFVHAYPDRTQGTINVRAELLGDDLVVSVADDGTGMRPNLESRGLGLGLAMIGRLTREFRIEAVPDGGALVTMRFAIGGAG